MQKEIRISKRLIGMIGLLLSALIFVVATLLPGKASSPMVTDEPLAVSDAGIAAQAGVVATFTANYREKDAWLSGVCAVSTEDACQFYTDLLAAGIWPQIETAKAIVTAEAVAVEKVDTLQLLQTDGSTRILENWRVAVKLSKPWPARDDDATEFVVYAQAVQEDGGWKFAGILLDGQAKQYEEQ
jgi:uncharacterized SAM-binding protein YcdF (DUF218 family)